MSTLIERTSNKLVKAFLKNKIIAPLPRRFTKKLTEANKFRMLCESKVKKPIIGYKAGGTGIPVMKKFCLLYTSPSPRDTAISRMPSSA